MIANGCRPTGRLLSQETLGFAQMQMSPDLELQMSFCHSIKLSLWQKGACMDQRNGDGKLGEIFTFDEVCKKLRISRRKLSDLIRGTHFYTRMGRLYRFSDADILAIWESMRPPTIGETRPLRFRKSRQVGASSEQLKKLLTGKARKRGVLKVGAPPDLSALFTGKPRKRPG